MPTDPKTGFYRQAAPLWLPRMVKERRQMIKQAMADKAPELLAQLTRTGALANYLNLKEEALYQEVEQMFDRIKGEMSTSKLPCQEMMQEANTKIMMAWQQALANHLEFPTTESSREE